MKTQDIEMAIYSNLARKDNKIICPNISWGLDFNHECDILVVDKNNCCSEIEIKVSKSDLKADAKKWHNHKSFGIKYLWFAIPERMNTESCVAMIPERAGIYVVKEIEVKRHGVVVYTKRSVEVLRRPKENPAFSGPLTETKIRKLAYLIQFRYWKTRAENIKLRKNIKPKSIPTTNQIQLL